MFDERRRSAKWRDARERPRRAASRTGPLKIRCASGRRIASRAPVLLANGGWGTMKLTDAQFGFLSTLQEFGPRDAIEVVGPPAMDGKRKVKLESHLGSSATLAALERAGFVDVRRESLGRPKNAVGKRGHERIQLWIKITDSGREVLAAA